MEQRTCLVNTHHQNRYVNVQLLLVRICWDTRTPFPKPPFLQALRCNRNSGALIEVNLSKEMNTEIGVGRDENPFAACDCECLLS